MNFFTFTFTFTFTKLGRAFLLSAVLAVGALSLAGCGGDDDNDGGGGGLGGGGSLTGTSWERRYTYDVYPFKDEGTVTITFTSEDRLTIRNVGWSDYTTTTSHQNGFDISYTTNTTRTNIDKTYNGTYTYYSNTKEGYMNCSYWEINPWNFRILSDNRTMAGKLDTYEFTKK